MLLAFLFSNIIKHFYEKSPCMKKRRKTFFAEHFSKTKHKTKEREQTAC